MKKTVLSGVVSLVVVAFSFPLLAADAEQAARDFVAKEHQRKAELQADRIGRLMDAANGLLADGRYDDAACSAELVLKEEPRNAEAAALLERIRKEQTRSDSERIERQMKDETAASNRYVQATRVPYAATLTLAKDWDEKSQRALARLAAGQVIEGAAQTERLKKGLEKRTSVDLIEVPVADVAAFLRQIAGINIVVERDIAEKTVTLQMQDTTIRAILDWTVRLTDTSYVLRQDAVHIGSREVVGEKPVVRIYDVSDILHETHLLTRGQQMKRAALGGAVGGDPFEDVAIKSQQELSEDLVDFLKEVTGRKYWDQGPGRAAMSIRFGRLVVNAEPTMQEKVRKILEGIR